MAIAMRTPLRRLLSSVSGASTGKRAPVRPGVVSPPLPVPAAIPRPHYAAKGGMSPLHRFIPILDAAEQHKLRAACALARDILEFARPLAQPGRTTDEIDRRVHEEIVRRGAYPSPLNYGHFPKALCSSVNEIVVHGIPDSRQLEDGDIVNIDISVFLDGFHGDTSQTFLVGDVDAAGRRLVDATNRALIGAIEQCCHPRSRFASIGAFVHDLSDREGLGVIEEYAGHGIGREFHAMPFILHHRNSEPGSIVPGMAFTVEPAICEGSPEVGRDGDRLGIWQRTNVTAATRSCTGTTTGRWRRRTAGGVRRRSTRCSSRRMAWRS
jgi:methionyl aminopeptidase